MGPDPKHLSDVVPAKGGGHRTVIDLQMMYRESFRFSSDPEPGLELVDIVTNALRRGLIGNLGEAGWLPLRGLMIHRSDVYVTPVGFVAADQPVAKPLLTAMNKFRTGGRNMSVPNLQWPQDEPAG